MKFEKVIPAYRKGKKIRRKCWNEDKIMDLRIVTGIGKYGYVKEGQFWKAVVEALLKADDWEIFDEKKPRKVKLRYLTPEQYKKWDAKNCSRTECRDCLFRRVECDACHENVWYLHKDLYSDKFLDQEIEIEE